MTTTTTWKWEDLKEIKGMSLDEVISWLKVHGEDENELDIEYYDEDPEDNGGWGSIDIGSYYSDSHPVIEFEHGKVARWYRDEDWD